MSESHRVFAVENPQDEQRFVGLRIQSGRPKLIFPLGYTLEQTVLELQSDARLLISLLRNFDHKHDETWSSQNQTAPSANQHLNIAAYMMVIEDFMRTGRLLTEHVSTYANSPDGRIDWYRTIATQSPVISNGTFIYLDLTSRQSTTNTRSFVTLAHELAIYVSFEKLGWLYPFVQTPRPTIKQNSPQIIAAVKDRLHHTFNDRELTLLHAILSILTEESVNGPREKSEYGVYEFEVAWELMIRTAFSSQSIELSNFFPGTKWTLADGHFPQSSLIPDVVMTHGDDLFILDAKYYRYGITQDHRHLPGSQDIAKQIIYGEYAHRKHGQKFSKIYNAFILPSTSTAHDGTWCRALGSATGDWTGPPHHSFQKILGVLVDTTFLLRNYSSSGPRLRADLADCIKQHS